MKKSNHSEYDIFRDSDDPLVRELGEKIIEARAKGLIKDPPKRAGDIKSMEDLCLYVFKLMQFNGEYQFRIINDMVTVWVWCGHEFRDSLIDKIEKILPQAAGKEALRELRLVDTRISASGLERLKRLFPGTNVTVYLPEDNPDWELAYYSGQEDNKWREQMIKEMTAYLE